MKKYNEEEAIAKLKEICEEHSKQHPDNTAAVITAENGSDRYPTVLVKRIGYKLFGRLQAVINRSDNEWHLRAEQDHVLLIIRFFR